MIMVNEIILKTNDLPSLQPAELYKKKKKPKQTDKTKQNKVKFKMQFLITKSAMMNILT